MTMSSKFSHRRTRVQHKPKVCKKPPPPPTTTALGHTVTYDFDLIYFIGFTMHHIIDAGSITGTLGSNTYNAAGTAPTGDTWTLALTWPPSPASGVLTMTSPSAGHTWTTFPIPGFILLPAGPLHQVMTIDAGLGGGNCILNMPA